MRYFISLDPAATDDAAQVEVDVHELPDGSLEVKVDGRPVDLDVRDIGRELSVRVDGQVVDLTIEGTPPDVGIIASGHRSYVRVVSERQRAAEAAKKGRGGQSEKVLKAPMPGRVVKLLVAPGDEVAQGQPLLVIEAMKMENELRAKAQAKVAEIHVAAGTAVEANAKLLTFA